MPGMVQTFFSNPSHYSYSSVLQQCVGLILTQQKVRKYFQANIHQTIQKKLVGENAKMTSNYQSSTIIYSSFFFGVSLHARLNSPYEAWSYKKKKYKKVEAYKKSLQKKPTVKRHLLILDLKPLRSQVKGKNSLPIDCFSLNYNLSGFKPRINSHLLTADFF